MSRIPKIIHFCWFGKSPYNNLAEKCIDSWKKHLPDYEIIEWNEKNFDLNSNPYVKEAYDSKKYAFVTDYVRLHALYNYGGIYMDTDVEVLKNIDDFLENPAFSGFENENSIPTAIMGSKKGNEWIKILLDYYKNKHFILGDGTFDTTTNVSTITNMTKNNYEIKLNNKYQQIDGIFTLYPKDFFCPKSYSTGKVSLTKNTYVIHHFNGSWLEEESVKTRKNNYKIIKLFGEKIGNVIIVSKRVYKEDGFWSLINRIYRKVN